MPAESVALAPSPDVDAVGVVQVVLDCGGCMGRSASCDALAPVDRDEETASRPPAEAGFVDSSGAGGTMALAATGEPAAPAAEGCECAICLGTAHDEEGGGRRIALRCGHGFCQACLLTCVRARMAARCPLCRQRLQAEEVTAFGMGDEEARRIILIGEQADSEPAAERPAPRSQETAEERRARRQFLRAARRGHWKRCPGCAVIIEKNDGCDTMRCRCFRRFSWLSAETVVPCRRVHWREGSGYMKYWGTTCPNCSPVATAKLAAWRTFVAMVGVPVGVLVVGAATVRAFVACVRAFVACVVHAVAGALLLALCFCTRGGGLLDWFPDDE